MKKLITLIALVAIAGSAQAAEIFHDNFDDTVDGQLRDESDWKYAGTSVGSPEVRSGNLDVAGLEPSTGSSLHGGAGTHLLSKTYLVSSFTGIGSTYYISVLINVDSIAGLDSTGVAILSFRSNKNTVGVRLNGTSNFDIGVGDVDNLSDAQWDTNGGSGYTTGGTHLIVMGYNSSWGANDYRAWIDPVPSSFGGTAPAYDYEFNGTAITGANSPWFWHDIPASVYYDELRYGDTFADVTPVAPGTSGSVIVIK